ncbi:hypothetical protein [Pseudoxanthomonas sp. SE1]|uniref:hypothetical protein n=1 Tax=Pseudoxanthomonas sp. SE1 TaxID=1664560 RepID=UPI00240CE78D|nr:hypothetical protein [Pseudoxanthomonas sp. SE1]WFC43188.1 hypothetical protein OY559_06675 [Pseudoxanthomonas sp. SE1]
MPERLSRAQRDGLRSVAEVEIMRYAHDHALWHKHIHNVTLDPVQVLKCIEMDRYPNTIDFSCRRTGKTAIKELYQLKRNATTADQELGIVGPREAQAIVNLNYHLEAIRRSPILTAFIGQRGNRPLLADTYYQFANRSRAKAYGIMANVDGGDMTAASLEEVDDMPRDRLYSRFLLMMGSTRRLGASEASENRPEIRVTGVFKGADTLSEMIAGGQYQALTTIDVNLGIELGILNAAFMAQMREELDADEYIRQLLCINVSSKNHIHERKLREAIQIGLRAGFELAGPLPGTRYKRRGLIGFGYDAGGHGENPSASRHCLVVAEMIGNWIFFPFVRAWPAGTDESVVRADLLELWKYFRPDTALGDAYGVGMIAPLNDDLFRERLTDIDRRAIGDGESTASTWPEWAFSPIRFEGMVKHQMAMALRGVFHNGHAIVPYFDDQDMRDPQLAELRTFIRQLGNVKSKASKAAYPSYVMADPKKGDDYFDAACAAVWSLAARSTAHQPTVILTSQRDRAQLLPAGAL